MCGNRLPAYCAGANLEISRLISILRSKVLGVYLLSSAAPHCPGVTRVYVTVIFSVGDYVLNHCAFQGIC